MSDEGLLSIDRDDLIEAAQQYYDAEVARRGLNPDPATQAPADPEQELVHVATFVSFEEANLAKALLRSADIPAYLENELSSTWTGLGGLQILVPAAFLEQAKEILDAPVSDEDLIAQAEAADAIDPAQEEQPD